MGTSVLTGVLTFTLGYGLVVWGRTAHFIGPHFGSVHDLPPLRPLFRSLAPPSEPLTLRRTGRGRFWAWRALVLIFSDRSRLPGTLAVMGGMAVLVSSCQELFRGSSSEVGRSPQPIRGDGRSDGLRGTSLLALGLMTEGSPFNLPWTPKALFSLFYLALVGTSLAFVLWYKLLQSSQVTRAQFMPVFNNLVAVILGWLVLHEHYGVRGCWAGPPFLRGLAMGLWKPQRAVAS